MKNIGIFLSENFHFFGVENFNIFEQACFLLTINIFVFFVGKFKKIFRYSSYLELSHTHTHTHTHTNTQRKQKKTDFSDYSRLPGCIYYWSTQTQI